MLGTLAVVGTAGMRRKGRRHLPKVGDAGPPPMSDWGPWGPDFEDRSGFAARYRFARLRGGRWVRRRLLAVNVAPFVAIAFVLLVAVIAVVLR